ncbi:MAG: CBS domain-containing protein [Spirulinaceae cyanobacterium SM2_1_0]|nr:CBS domain-containing protein [Spirulinaceae cyanobacterium SM2_1_0]
MSQTVADFMMPDPVTVKPQLALSDAIQLLVERQASCLLVVDDDDALIGILSESDLMWQATGVEPPPYIMLLDSAIFLRNPARYEKELHKALGQTVGDVMTAKPITIAPERSLREAAQVMHDKHIHRLPVIDASDRLVGLITQSDIIRAMAAN